MNLRRVGPAVIFIAPVFFALTCVARAQQPESVLSVSGLQSPSRTNPIVLEGADAVGAIEKSKIADCIDYTAHELHVEDKELPKILVYHVSQETADSLGIVSGSTWRTRGKGQFRYEMWVVGAPSNANWSHAIMDILQQYFEMDIPARQRDKMMEHVERRLDATVSVKILH
jgi:hypothetical protein